MSATHGEGLPEIRGGSHSSRPLKPYLYAPDADYDRDPPKSDANGFPPIVRGGQGHSASSVERGGWATGWLIAALAVGAALGALSTVFGAMIGWGGGS
jgi:hypothetical protein